MGAISKFWRALPSSDRAKVGLPTSNIRVIGLDINDICVFLTLLEMSRWRRGVDWKEKRMHV